MAKANGTVNPTYPRYRIGGWNSTSTWFCSSGLGPAQHFSRFTGVTPWANASVGPSARKKKNAVTASIVTIAHATSGSLIRAR